jgi:hypothetical protein
MIEFRRANPLDDGDDLMAGAGQLGSPVPLETERGYRWGINCSIIYSKA